MIGAGNYAGAVLIPALKAAGAELDTVVSGTGVSAFHARRKFGFSSAGADALQVIKGAGTDTVVIATRHNLHADQTVAALEAGKHVFVEKPLAITLPEVDRIEAAWQATSNCALMVGFNRRFAPFAIAIKEALAARGGRKAMLMTINAGALPADHWTVDPVTGGGRIIGEGVHFVDLARFFAGAQISAHKVSSLSTQSALIQLVFANGDIASIAYLANGNKSMPKERIEIFCDGAIYQIDNWRKLTVSGNPAVKSRKLWVQDKGQEAMARAFVAHVRGEAAAPIPPEELFETARAVIAITGEMHPTG